MVLLSSTNSDIQNRMPEFTLMNTSNEPMSSSDCMGKLGCLVIFTCNHCPYAVALWDRLIDDYQRICELGFNVVAINPNNHPDYPDDSFEKMCELKLSKSLPFNYLWDETQMTAKSYDAQCTPDLYLLDTNHQLIYRGAYDDNWKSHQDVTQNHMLTAMDHFSNHGFDGLSGIGLASMGCSIKWNEKS